MRRLTYLFDPLCGWCYGASPALERLMAHESLTIDLVPTGLFADEGAFPMNAAFAAHAWEADQRIARLSGQRFTEQYRVNVLASRTAAVDSGPATLGLTAVRLTAPEREFEALKAIQHVRYVEGRDNGDPAVIADVLAGLGLAEAAARCHAADEELLAANRARIAEGRAEMQRFGARGVPTLILDTGRGRATVDASALFGEVDRLAAALDAA
ncbi:MULTISPECIES: DsbA family protein [Chelatococcus]|uniref:DSBA-like thioredoxin domain-containing protein n=1 Tax=Chelatococcus caeni TaxID=1348468 RepID=A0A840BWV8_9HYPH|nr:MULTISPECIES: DsbA family protein [Chelatococcus]ALA18674.1 protein-disulfide isomerase [Chelatococcus sp. CO-6]MBB4015829.1 putative protein-disulfide isomerase [Chelatococcus caeni]